MHDETRQSAPRKRPARFSLTVPPRQQATLEELAQATGISKNELIRQAIGLLAIAVTARDKGLVLALANGEDRVLSHIVTSI